MSPEQFAIVCVGITIQAATFGLGIAVGASIAERIKQRKAAPKATVSEYEDRFRTWHTPVKKHDT